MQDMRQLTTIYFLLLLSFFAKAQDTTITLTPPMVKKQGLPQKVLEKIFQPFFTTKPTGEGTGLRLSLSYDIITKGHGGELKVQTSEGDGSSFIILLPNHHAS